MYRSETNEKRARSLFDALGGEQILVDRVPKANPDWDKQPERIKDIFRESASFNTYKHQGTGDVFCWTFCDRAIKMIEVNNEC